MKILITGGAGFLGQRLARALLRSDAVGRGRQPKIDQLVLARRGRGERFRR